MTILTSAIKSAVAAVALSVAASATFAQSEDLDPLFEALQDAEGQAAQEIEGKIWQEWSRSGSAAMDLLLTRGREALEAGQVSVAIEHFTALIDHAPEFPEGYNARATAYFQAGRYGPSIADIRATLIRNPRHFGALGGLALILEDIGERAGALEAYEQVEALYPNREGLQDAIARLTREVYGSEI